MLCLSYLQINILNLFINNLFLISSPYDQYSEKNIINQDFIEMSE